MSTGLNGSRLEGLTLLDGLAGKAGYYVAKMKGPASVRQRGDITVVDSGIASDTFNCVVSRGLDETGDPDASDTIRAIADICSNFNEAELPAAWWTCDGIRPEFVARELARYHFIEDETDVGMLADLESIPPANAPGGFVVRVVSTAQGVLEQGALLAGLAEPADPHTLAYYTNVSELDDLDGPMRLFVGYLDGQPVSTASLFRDGDTAHVYDVSTSPAARGQGVGTAMMRAVLEHAREAGARRAGLMASDEGIGVYRRMGFKEVCLFRVYSNQRHIADARVG